MTRLTSGVLRCWARTLPCTTRHMDLDGDPALTSASGAAGAGARTGSAVLYSSTTTSSTAMDFTATGTAATEASTVNVGHTIQVTVSVSLTPTVNLRDVSRRLRPLRERIGADWRTQSCRSAERRQERVAGWPAGQLAKCEPSGNARQPTRPP
jgi:hypothetical protein